MKRSLLTLSLTAVVGTGSASAQEKITFNDHARAVLENKCFSCHNPDKKKGDLDLTSFAGTMAGGGGGAIVTPGDAEGSRLITTTTKKEEPFMPPEGAPLSAQEIEVLSKWIQGGVLETASSVAKKAQPKASLTLASVGAGKPEGPPPMPEHVLLEPVLTAPRDTAITALAAGPWAPLLAVSGQKQALVYDTENQVLAGVYPYPEGYLRSLKFSQNGTLLVGGGGRGGKSGNAVVWDVKTGRRVAEVGAEFDQVTAADISPNHGMVAIGSPSKKVKVYSTAGEEQYLIKKHTEWILALAFSPDGVLLASADRNGGVIVSEASTGGEFYLLDGHKAACNSVAWRSDSNVLASCGEDGKVITYEMENGKVVKNWDAHPGGCLSVSFTTDGNIVSSGRDGFVRIWDINGKKISESAKQPDLVTEVAALYDGKSIVTGDWQGKVRIWKSEGFAELGNLSANPQPLAQRIADSERAAKELVAQVPVQEAALKKAQENVAAREGELQRQRQAQAERPATVQKLEAEIKALPSQIEAAKKGLAEVQGKKQAQADVLKKYEQALAQIKEKEAMLTTLQAERAKLVAPEQAEAAAATDKKVAEVNAQLAPLRQATAAAPQPIAQFDPAIKDATDKLNAHTLSQAALPKQLAEVKKASEAGPPHIANIEKEVIALRVARDAADQKLKAVRHQATYHQKLPGLLRAAQFNVNVLAQKQDLEKMEAEVKGLQEGLVDAESSRVTAVQKIEDSKKAIAEATAAMPTLEAALSKVSGELPAVEKSLEPAQSQLSAVKSRQAEQQKSLGAKESELKALEQEKSGKITAAQKTVEEINKQVAVLQKQLDETNQKLAGPAKATGEKQAAFSKLQGEVEGIKKQHAQATQETSQSAANAKAKESEFQAASLAVKAEPDPEKQKVAVERETAARAAVEAARKQASEAQNRANQAKMQLDQKQGALARAKTEADAAAKVSNPLSTKQQSLTAELNRLRTTLAAKQAEPAAAEKQFAEKAQPVQALIAQLKGVLGEIDKEVAAAQAKLEAEQKVVAAKRDEVVQADLKVVTAKKTMDESQKAIDGANTQIQDLAKAKTEMTDELAKVEPQLEPLRTKVKQLSEQYLAMLPK